MEDRIIGYLAVDVERNNQSYITGGTLEDLKKAADMGIVFVAEFADGTRKIVKPEQINFENLRQTSEIHIVQQEIFVPLMESLLELMEESMSPAVSVLSITPGVGGTAKTINHKFADFKDKVNNMLEIYKPNLEGGDDGDNS